MKQMPIAVLLLLALAAGAAPAADQSPSPTPRAACKGDVEKLCPDVQPGGGRIIACLKQNAAQVSAPCKDALLKARERKAPGALPPPPG